MMVLALDRAFILEFLCPLGFDLFSLVRFGLSIRGDCSMGK